MGKLSQFLIFTLAWAFLMSYPKSLAFTTKTKAKILQDAIDLSPEPLGSFLQANKPRLEEALTKRHVPLSAEQTSDDRLIERIINHFNALQERLPIDPDKFNTYIHFAELADVLCDYVHRRKGDSSTNAHVDCAPKEVRFEGYQEVREIENTLSHLASFRREAECGESEELSRQYNLAVSTILNFWISVWNASQQKVRLDPQKTMIIRHDGPAGSSRLNYALFNDSSPDAPPTGGQSEIGALELRALQEKLQWYQTKCVSEFKGSDKFKEKHAQACRDGAKATMQRIGELQADEKLYFHKKEDRDKRRLENAIRAGRQSGHPAMGAVDPGTGKFYPGVPGGVINPETGQFYPRTGGGYFNPRTGDLIPAQ